MRHEAFGAHIGDASRHLDTPPAGLRKAGPIAVFGRTLDVEIARAIDELPIELLPSIRSQGDIAALDATLKTVLSEGFGGPSWLAAWLCDDIAFLARLFAELTGAGSFVLRLEPVVDDACSRFHADNMTYRLMTTYRGRGTEWVSPRDSHLVEDGELAVTSVRRQLERGWVGVLRGSKGATATCPAVLHRSPPVPDRDSARLFLAIDDARDWAPRTPVGAPAPERPEHNHGV